MKNRLVAFIAAVVVGMSLVPPVAGAEDAEGPNPFTFTFANGMCSFGVDDRNPEMKLSAKTVPSTEAMCLTRSPRRYRNLPSFGR